MTAKSSVAITFLTPTLDPPVEALLRTISAIRVVSAAGLDVEHVLIDGGRGEFDVDLAGAVVIHAPGTNISEALTLGWERASGRYVMVMNAGDVPTEHLSAMVRHLDQAVDDVVVCPVSEPQNGVIRPQRRASVLHSTWVHAGMIARTELLGRCGGYSRRFQFAMDWEWLSRAETAGVTISFLADAEPIVEMEPFGLSRQRMLSSAGEYLDIVRRDIPGRWARLRAMSRHLPAWSRAFFS